MKRGRMEQATLSFRCYGHALDNTPDLDLPDPSSVSADARLLVAEAMISCTSGMLLCLDREQRLIYISKKNSVIRFSDEHYPSPCPSTSLRYAQGERERSEKAVLRIAMTVIHNRSRQREAVAFARLRRSRVSRRQVCSRSVSCSTSRTS